MALQLNPGEATVYLMFLWVQLASAAFLAVRTGPNGGDPLRFLMLLVGSFLLLFPTLFHAGSTKHRADKLLQAQLSSFLVFADTSACFCEI